MLDIEMKAVQVDLYTNMQRACTQETCDKKSDINYIDAAITEIYETIDELEGITCSKETCSQIRVEADEKGNNIQAEVENLEINTCTLKTCSKLQRMIETIDNCMGNPWDANCLEDYSTSNSMPKTMKTFSECFRNGITLETLDLIKYLFLFSSPSSSACVSQFSRPSSLPSVLASLCPMNTCSAMESCLLDPGSESLQ